MRSVYTWINPKILKKCDNLNHNLLFLVPDQTTTPESDIPANFNNGIPWDHCTYWVFLSLFDRKHKKELPMYIVHSFLTFFYVTWCIVHAVCIDMFVQIGFMLVYQFLYSTHNFKENFNCAWNTKICWIDGLLTSKFYFDFILHCIT